MLKRMLLWVMLLVMLLASGGWAATVAARETPAGLQTNNAEANTADISAYENSPRSQPARDDATRSIACFHDQGKKIPADTGAGMVNPSQ